MKNPEEKRGIGHVFPYPGRAYVWPLLKSGGIRLLREQKYLMF